MKKKLCVLMAGVFGAAAMCGLVACGPSYDDSVYDVEAKPFDSADAVYTLNGKVDKTDAVTTISDTLFGVFLEDINYASYALTDNLVANGSFDAITGSGAKYGWTSKNVSTFDIQSTDGIFKGTDYASVNPNYAVVTAQAGGYIANAGYEAVPMAVESGVDYVFSAFIKSPSAVDMKVSVTDGETSYVEGTVNLLASSEWVKYTRTFTATESASEGLSLRLTFNSAATVYLDAVSFQTTDSTLGIKNYLYEAIADLSPKFIRFPGGCVIEGTLDNVSAYDWKNSIGAVVKGDSDVVPAFSYRVNTDGTTQDGDPTYGEQATRKHNRDIWSGSNYYDMDYALGFYEYFLLCDSLGASAVPVVNCGLSDMGGLSGGSWNTLNGRHGKGTADYIQDAKDLICFAKGSVTSSDPNEAYWAQVRTNMGHPEPFDMQYIGIGNEQFDKVYFQEHYEKFLEAFKADANPIYQTVKPIVGNAMTFANCENPTVVGQKGEAQGYAEAYKASGKIENISEYGVHDQHYYMNYADFFKNADMYDYYTKSFVTDSYYEVFVGEYSANSVSSGGKDYSVANGNSQWANSWITALSEAAMMTCYERNGDIVKLAAYAPMFAPVSTSLRQWATDMMYFTNTELVLSTNYYVQQLFMKNQGRYYLEESGVEYAPDFETTCPLVGVGTSATTALATNINKLYYVASMAENGDLILKIVNASADSVKFNVQMTNANVRKVAEVTVLHNDDYTAVNTLGNTKVKPETFTIGGWEGDTLGYEVSGYSVTCIRVLTK